ncbi:hypothetical protein [Serratia symbiotica]|uniref:hypothetical protein n=1 Tax=Serratia symbiotica TaxID=138074 RepID=UPI0013249B6A|nr:hypothetical protein [Serratia symbiotica]QTP13347.1 hypothetical protein GPZ83_0000490 [Serratia symbiotica]
MNYLDDNNENVIELPQFGPASNEAENDTAERLVIPDYEKKEFLHENGIPVYDKDNEDQFAVAGLLEATDGEWVAVEDIDEAEVFGIVRNKVIIEREDSFEKLVANYHIIIATITHEVKPQLNEHDLLAGAKSTLELSSGDLIEIDNLTRDHIKINDKGFSEPEWSDAEFEELKLKDGSVHITPDTKERIIRELNRNGKDGAGILEENIGETYPAGSRTYHFENVEIDPNDDGDARQRFTVGANGGAMPQQAQTYKKNMAEVQNGVGHLAGGVASLVGGGAALTGVLAHKAGAFLKSLSTGLTDRNETVKADNSSRNKMSQNEMTASPQAESEPVITNDQPMTYGLPAPSKSPDNFLFEQMEARREEYSNSIRDFWAHEKIKPIKSQIEALARESGVSVSEMNQKVTHEPEYAYLRESIRHAVETDSELKDTLRTADSNFDEWIETYQVLKDKQERVVDPEAADMLDNELENQRAQMEEAVSEAPPGEGMFSKLEELKMKLKEIVEKIREVISKWTSSNDNESGNSPAP